MRKWFTFVLCGIVALAAVADTGTVQPFVADRVLVKFHDQFLPEGWRAGDLTKVHPAIAKLRPVGASYIVGIDVLVIDLKPGSDAPAAVRALAKHPDVEFAELDLIYEALWTPNDPLRPNQYGLGKIFAYDAWNIWRGDANFFTCVADTGIDHAHQDLSGKYAGGHDYVNSDTNPMDDHGHGTHCSGIAAAMTNNGIGIAGVDPLGRLKATKVLSAGGSGNTANISNGITWAANNGCHTVSLSLGGGGFSNTMNNAVNFAWNAGCVVVAAAGNNGNTTVVYPAGYTNALAVASTTSTDARSSFSSYGSWVQVAAPGSSIRSTLRNNAYGDMSGTSMACPHVAGMATWLYSKLIVNPASRSVTHATRIRQIIEDTADPVGTFVTKGRVNMNRAIRAIVINGDVNGDGCVDDRDLAMVLDAYGDSGPNRADLNNTGIVDDADLALVLAHFGAGCI